MKLPRRLIWLATLLISLFALPGLNPAQAGLNRAGDLLYRDPRTSNWLIQDRIVPPATPSGARLSVDLSSQMPPVGNQLTQGSCVAWSVGYYHKTHQEWLEHGWDVSQTAHQVSPAYIYNQINGGVDSGAYFEDAQQLLCEQGACSMQDFPYNTSNWWAWPSESAFARGILWRSNAAYWIDVTNDAGLARVKARLDSGFTTALGIRVYSNFDNINSFDTTYCACERYGTNRGGHGVTFVGYDDTKVTSDGTGAFSMVNSWGTGWGHAGYWWMSYQAVKDNYLSEGAAYYVTDRIAYQPRLLARVQIMDSTRDRFGIRMGVGRSSSPLWTKDFRQFGMRQQQSRSFPNTKLVFDMTEGDSWLAKGSTDSVFVRCIDDSSDGYTGRIDFFSGEYLPWLATGVSVDPPVTIPDYNVAAYARARLRPLHDVQAMSVVAPAGTVDSGGAGITPQAWVRDRGVDSASFPVWLKVAPSYVSNQYNVSKLPPGDSLLVSFTPTWSPVLRGSHVTTCSTALTGDNSTGNDTISGSVLVSVRDVGCSKIEFPYGTLDSGASITPACSVSNYGTTTEGAYLVRMLVGTGPAYYYNGTAVAPSLDPGERGYVAFSPVVVNWPRGGPYTVRCSTELTGDLCASNNRAPDRTVSVQVQDVGCTKIEYPYGTLDSGASITPACSVANYGMIAEGGYTVRMLVGTGPAYYYNGTAVAPSVDPGERGYVTFSPVAADWPRGGPYPVVCSTELAGDVIRSNNRAPQRTVSVRVRDVGCSKIQNPFGTIDTGRTVTPACSVSNYGTTVEGGFRVRMLVGTAPAYVYNDTAHVTSLNPGQRGYFQFPSVQANWARGAYPVNCSTELTTDMVPADNRAPARSVTLRVIDVGCTKIEFPFGTVDSCASIVPACSVYNYGTTNEGGYLIRMLVGTGPSYFYNATTSAPLHMAGQYLYVAFPSTVVRWPRGGPYPVRCSTELPGDANRSNSSAPQRSVSVQVRDVGCTKIESPVGALDSGASFVPACSVYNYGTTTEGGYLVRMLVGSGPSYRYNDTASAPSLDPGQLGYVTFPAGNADWPRGTYPVRCSTEFPNDAKPSNNRAQQMVAAQVRDVGCLSILTPSGDVDSVGPLSPQARVRNFGNADLSTSFDVVFTIGSYTSVKSVPALAHYADTLLVFDSPPWGCPSGPFSGTCETQLSGDMYPANDQQATTGRVRIVDVGCDTVLVPSGVIDSTGPFTPRARVKNYGVEDVTTPFDVVFTIGDYRSTKQVPGLAHGATAEVDFDSPPWGCPRGAFTAKCSSQYNGDAFPNNNAQTQTGTVWVWDVGAAAISAPTGEVAIYSTISPTAVVQNFGTEDITCSVRLTIRNAASQLLYDRTEDGVFVPAGGQVPLAFGASWRPDVTGRCSVEVRTSFANDANPANDVCRRTVRVVSFVSGGWVMQAGLPQGMKGKNVKDGGALAYATVAGNDTGFVYAFKGNNTTEFYRFNVLTGAWTALDTIPRYNRNRKKKGVKKGASLVMAGDGHIYATKGASTLDWWEYVPGVGHDTWLQKADVPVGSKNVKEGTGGVAVTEGGINYIYLLKGSGTFEFYRYNVKADAWEAMPNAPLGGGKPYKAGSALVYNGASAIYALKGSYNEFFYYDVLGRCWLPLAPLPLGVIRKKAKDGAGLAYDNAIVYALKGGNTDEFWTFEATAGRWLQGQSMGTSPAGKRVKYGGGLVAATGMSALYAFRGNNTLEFWSYGIPVFDEPRLAAEPGGAQGADAARAVEFGLRVAPNPLAAARNPSITYSLPVAGEVSLGLYDVTGKLMTTLAQGHALAGSHRVGLSAVGGQLSAGVYVLKLESGEYQTTSKLIVE